MKLLFCRSAILQVILALVLLAGIFYLFSLGFLNRPDHNRYSQFMTVFQSEKYHENGDIPQMWDSRFLPCLLSGMWFDFWSPDTLNWAEGRACFAGFHIIWVSLLF